MTPRSQLAHHLFLYGLEANNGFHIFKRLEKKKSKDCFMKIVSQCP